MNEENGIEITGDSIILAKPGIILREEADNWGLIYNPDTDFSFGVNPVSVFIWKQLENKHTIKELVNKVKKQCTGVAEEVEEDVSQFVKKLVDNGLATLEIA